MQAVLPPTKATRAHDDVPDLMDDDQYFDFCQLYPKLRIERTAEGEVIIMPPVGLESGDQEAEVLLQLRTWSKKDRRGRAFGSNTEYILPNRAAYAPDVSWISDTQLKTLSKDEKSKFPHLVPEFVVEVRSPSDRLTRTAAKMEEWISNGVQLGWLIDGRRRTVTIYRPDHDPETLSEPAEVIGEGPIEGFRLNMADVWEGF